jgi:hypothetical protein
MIRDNVNPLGVAEGAVDVYVRSRRTYTFGESIISLVYDSGRAAWVGRLNLPVTPSFFALKNGIFQVSTFDNARGVNKIYARSAHPQVDSLGIAYSRYETLGIMITDYTPDRIDPGSISDITHLAGAEPNFSVSGDYAGYIFHSRTERQLILRFDAVTTVDGKSAAVVSVRDQLNNEAATVYFVGNTVLTGSSTYGEILKSDDGYRQMLNGLTLTIKPLSGAWDPALLIGNTYMVHFKGRTAQFSVNYLYDPGLIQIESSVQDPDNKPAGVSILTKSFIICHIDKFTVNYRTRFGSDVDRAAAQQEIFEYLNGLVYPDIYEESKIGEIMLRHGAAGMQSITQRGVFYPSLANVFVKKDQTESEIKRFETRNLLPPINDFGFGPRNIAYVVDQATITFNSIVI